jgi:hypothetical protein
LLGHALKVRRSERPDALRGRISNTSVVIAARLVGGRRRRRRARRRGQGRGQARRRNDQLVVVAQLTLRALMLSERARRFPALAPVAVVLGQADHGTPGRARRRLVVCG